MTWIRPSDKTHISDLSFVCLGMHIYLNSECPCYEHYTCFVLLLLWCIFAEYDRENRSKGCNCSPVDTIVCGSWCMNWNDFLLVVLYQNIVGVSKMQLWMKFQRSSYNSSTTCTSVHLCWGFFKSTVYVVRELYCSLFLSINKTQFIADSIVDSVRNYVIWYLFFGFRHVCSTFELGRARNYCLQLAEILLSVVSQ